MTTPQHRKLTAYYRDVRSHSEALCAALPVEDYNVQAAEFASPAKWHLAHTTWFFEQIVLVPHSPDYTVCDDRYGFLFNSYYETVGARHARPARGLLTRPTVEQVYAYRRHVDDAMLELLQNGVAEPALAALVVLGLNHEQQHQELFATDLKYNLGTQPTHPPYDGPIDETAHQGQRAWLAIEPSVNLIGHEGQGFCFDNELPRHRVYVHATELCTALVTNGAYQEFIDDGGYGDHRHWHSDGWTWRKANQVEAPLYWRRSGDAWMEYTLRGLAPVDPDSAVMHVSYYEAAAYASWAGGRLPTEAQREVAADRLSAAGPTAGRWEWTGSAYLPYPGYQPATGAVGEYNGKFMVNQMVLRGSSVATPAGHSRATYRNFYYPDNRWQYSGIRLAR